KETTRRSLERPVVALSLSAEGVAHKMPVNIRTKLLIGLVGLCGVFGTTGWVFYNQIKTFDQDVHELEDLTDIHLQQNLSQLVLENQALTSFKRVMVALDKVEPGTQLVLATQLAAFEAQITELLQNQSAPAYELSGQDHEHHEGHDHHEREGEAKHHEEHDHAPHAVEHHEEHQHEQVAVEPHFNEPALTIALTNSLNTLEAQSHDFVSAVQATIAAAQASEPDRFKNTKQVALALAPQLETTLITLNENLQIQASQTLGQIDRSVYRFDESIHSFIRIFWVGAIAGVVVSGGIGFWLIQTISRPLTKLKQATARISAGDWQTVPVLNANDEIGEVTQGFNAMTERLQETYRNLEQQISALEASETELRTAKQAAEHANLAKSTFLANMSHELRTPLNAIIGYSEMLQEEAEDLGEEDFVPDLAKIHGAGKHLLSLINDILDISKIEAGRMELYLETFDLNGMLMDVATTIAPLVENNNNTLVLDYPANLGSMHSDITKLRQNLFNLLSNACKFTHEGTITLRVAAIDTELGECLHFTVTDTGIGMASEQVAQVFESFAQADASTTRKYGGTGLGLTITRSFCQMLGGDITVTSTQGEGSTFTMTLPRQVATPPNSATLPVVEGLPLNQGNGIVLVIDDDASVCDYLQRSLSRYGYQVEVATNGAEGLELAKGFQPGAIALDVMMPGMDGWAVLTALKGDPETAHIPVVMLTMVNERNLGYALGASDYLLKPVNRDQLLLTLRRFRGGEGGNSILIVDDSAMNREVLRRQIEKEGWAVEEAQHGRQALDLIQIHQPDVILLDLMMPEMDGFQFLEALRENTDWQAIPVVVITAKDITESDRQRLNGGVEAIYHKGNYDRQTLVNEVQRLLQTVMPQPPSPET
ncbi:MAG: response regulator, partial [Spirulina sp. SIO3F2]|nr:response regulator [Spirulina sp. SIO3F2]